MNDDWHNYNLKAKPGVIDSVPRELFFAVRDIKAGEELTYNYGEGTYWWR